MTVAERDNPLTYRWELLPEATDLKNGGDHDSRPAAIPGLFSAQQKGQVQPPAQVGTYRLFVYASDGHGNVATGNIPFYVGWYNEAKCDL